MNIIKRIKIENIKGKDNWELTFDDFNANQPNIIVAPNGYGKAHWQLLLKQHQGDALN